MRVEKILLTITEVGMILYWLFATLVLFEIINVSPEIMYSNYQDETMVAWNWSFLPLDIIFAITGLSARFLNISNTRRSILSIFSLALMFCAGLFALSFWVIESSFDPLWWGINLWLLLLSIFVLYGKYFGAREKV